MNLFRVILFRVLGKRLYFRFVSRMFILMYRMGALKWFGKFRTHHTVPALIREGDYIIDIGANLGYYTTIFSRKAGSDGKVFAIEHIPDYREILARNCKGAVNLEIMPIALSNNKGVTEMGIPDGPAYRHGLTRILEEEGSERGNSRYRVDTDTPENLFGDIERLDYIKCDIEGYEGVVIPEFRSLIEKFNPILQVEIEKSNFETVSLMLAGLGYKPYVSYGKGLRLYSERAPADNDIIFIPPQRELDLEGLILKF